MLNTEKIKHSKICPLYRCYICHSTDNLDLHHAIHGNGKRKLADLDGLFVMMCRTHHERLHNQGEHDTELKILAQRAYLKDHTKEEFIRRYGKAYE